MNLRLVFLPRAEGDQPWSTLVDPEGRILARGSLDETKSADRTILVTPGSEALVRWIDLPARSEAQARSAAAFLLEDELAGPRDSVHVALGPTELDGRRMVAIVDRLVMSRWMAQAHALDIEPDAVIPDHLLLRAPEGDAVTGVRIGPSIALRGVGLSATCEADLAPFLVGERPLTVVETPEDVEAVLAAGAPTLTLDLLQGDFAKRPEFRPSVRAFAAPAALALLVVLMPLVHEGVRIARFEAAATAAEARAEAVARAALPPELAQSPDPLAVARARLAALDAERGGGFLAPAAALFAAVEQAPGMQLTTLNYTPEGALRVTVSYASPADLEALRGAIARAGFQLDEGETTSSAGQSQTELTLRSGA